VIGIDAPRSEIDGVVLVPFSPQRRDRFIHLVDDIEDYADIVGRERRERGKLCERKFSGLERRENETDVDDALFDGAERGVDLEQLTRIRLAPDDSVIFSKGFNPL
jgi:hypothetical protein